MTENDIVTLLGKKLIECEKLDVGQHKITLIKSYFRRAYALGIYDVDLIALTKNSLSELRTARLNLKVQDAN